MPNAATIPVPTVSARGVALASRALFAYLGALLGPLMAQHIFGRGAPFAALALAAGVGAIAGGRVGRLVSRPYRSRHVAAAAVLLASMLFGLCAGMLCGVAWVTVIDVHPSLREPVPVGLLFGGIFGVTAGALFAAPFAVWASRARAALDAPSAVSAQRLAVDGGILVTAGGVLAANLYASPALSAVGVGTAAMGTVLVMVTVLRAIRLRRLTDAVARGELSLAPRGELSVAPALVSAAPLDHVLVQPIEQGAGPAPFRATEAVRELAAVPADLGVARRAIGGVVAYGVVALALASLLDATLIARALRCDGGCPSRAAPCDCSH